MKIGNCEIPPGVKAVLWDMDGVLINSLEFDYLVCSDLVSTHAGQPVTVPDSLVSKYFAFAHLEFWQGVLRDLEVTLSDEKFDALIEDYHGRQHRFTYSLYPGVTEHLCALEKAGIISAVVSSNETRLIREILRKVNLLDQFKEIVGYDACSPTHPEGLKKKPHPDMYEAALALLGLKPEEAVVVEDSIAGSTAGFAANCFVVGIATGGTSFELLSEFFEGKRGHVIRSLVE